jgi:hydrogenase/urease accessory protein HupE
MVVLATIVALVLQARPALAHTIGMSTGEYAARSSSVVAKLAFARAEVASLLPGIDTNRDGHLTAAEVDAARTVLRDRVLARIVVTVKGAACAPVLTDAALTELDGLLISARWDCKSSDAPFDVELLLLDELGKNHKHIARTSSHGVTHDEVFSADARTFAIEPDDAVAPAAEHRARVRPSFFWMGIVHILEGADHLVFLAGLVLVRARVRSLVAVVTAFTIAHSITLGLAAFGVWSPPPSIVEPAIGLTIAYVGIENFVVKDAAKRWRITFPFGLIHGFGFASALREVAIERSAIPAALLGFNLGVEVGQLAVLAVLVPIVMRLHREDWFERWGMRVASGAVVAAGLVWFVVRIVVSCNGVVTGR